MADSHLSEGLPGACPRTMHSIQFILTISLLSAAGSNHLASEPAGGAPVAKRSASDSCASCHSLHKGSSHPVGVRVEQPTGLPLEAGQLMTCLTCHDVTHSHSPGANADAALGLREPARKLCAACHTVPADPGSNLAHGLYDGRAHLGVSFEERQPKRGLDLESRRCLGCHDGGVASLAQFKEGSELGSVPSRSLRITAADHRHPVGVPYKPGRANKLRPAGSLPGRVRLFSESVGCGSCHSSYAGLPSLVALDGTHGQLCLSCHIK